VRNNYEKNCKFKPQKKEIHEFEQKSSQKSYLKMGSLPYSYHYYSTRLAEPSLFFAKYLIIFSKKIGRIEENYLNKKKSIIGQSFVNQCTLFPNKILKGISKIFTLKKKFWGKSLNFFF